MNTRDFVGFTEDNIGESENAGHIQNTALHSLLSTETSMVKRRLVSGRRTSQKCLRCFKLRPNRKLYVKHHADKLNVGDLFFSASVNPPLPPPSVFGSFLAFVR